MKGITKSIKRLILGIALIAAPAVVVGAADRGKEPDAGLRKVGVFEAGDQVRVKDQKVKPGYAVTQKTPVWGEAPGKVMTGVSETLLDKGAKAKAEKDMNKVRDRQMAKEGKYIENNVEKPKYKPNARREEKFTK
jgi:hypothetical protein